MPAMKTIYVYDAYNNWVHHIREAAIGRSIDVVELRRGDAIPAGGYVFARLSMKPDILTLEKRWLSSHMDRDDLHWITDQQQVRLYESKLLQTSAYNGLLPRTHIVGSKSEMRRTSRSLGFPLVSKASVGASSRFVRILHTVEGVEAEGHMIFDGPGYPLKGHPPQKGYMILQEFLPDNDFTWRANIVGSDIALFKRHNHPNVPMAQTGNVTAVDRVREPRSGSFERMWSDADLEELQVILFAESVAAVLETRWCALDILRAKNGSLALLETSLGWPWPGAGDGAVFLKSGRPWAEMWSLMLDSVEDGYYD